MSSPLTLFWSEGGSPSRSSLRKSMAMKLCDLLQLPLVPLLNYKQKLCGVKWFLVMELPLYCKVLHARNHLKQN